MIVTWTMVVAIKINWSREICEIWGCGSRRNHAWLTSFKLEQLGKWWCHLFKLNVGCGEDIEEDNSSLTCSIWAISVMCKWRFEKVVWYLWMELRLGVREHYWRWSDKFHLMALPWTCLITCHSNNDFHFFVFGKNIGIINCDH